MLSPLSGYFSLDPAGKRLSPAGKPTAKNWREMYFHRTPISGRSTDTLSPAGRDMMGIDKTFVKM